MIYKRNFSRGLAFFFLTLPTHLSFANDQAKGLLDEELRIAAEQLESQDSDVDEDSSEAEALKSFSPLGDFEAHYQSFYAANPEGAEKKAILLVSGGWGSCKNDQSFSYIFEAAAQLAREALQKKIYYQIVGTCYGKLSSEMSIYLSWKPNQLYSGSPKDLADFLQKLSKAHASRPLYALGHSYGAWLGLATASHFSKDMPLRGLASVDAISRVNCTPPQLIWSYLRSQLGTYPHPGCTEAPQDIPRPVLSRIAALAGWWDNYFETDAVFLHSSSIELANNYLIGFEVGGPFSIFDPHRKIFFDPRVWGVLKKKLLEFK